MNIFHLCFQRMLIKPFWLLHSANGFWRETSIWTYCKNISLKAVATVANVHIDPFKTVFHVLDINNNTYTEIQCILTCTSTYVCECVYRVCCLQQTKHVDFPFSEAEVIKVFTHCARCETHSFTFPSQNAFYISIEVGKFETKVVALKLNTDMHSIFKWKVNQCAYLPRFFNSRKKYLYGPEKNRMIAFICEKDHTHTHEYENTLHICKA